MNIIKTLYWSMKPLRTYEDFLYIDHKMWLKYFCAQNKEKNKILVKQRFGETLFTVRPEIVHERSKLAISGLIE